MIYLTLDTTAPNYKNTIADLAGIHEGAADGARLSIAPLKNNKVLVKVAGLTNAKAEGKAYFTDIEQTFTAKDKTRLDFYKLNKKKEAVL